MNRPPGLRQRYMLSIAAHGSVVCSRVSRHATVLNLLRSEPGGLRMSASRSTPWPSRMSMPIYPSEGKRSRHVPFTSSAPTSSTGTSGANSATMRSTQALTSLRMGVLCVLKRNRPGRPDAPVLVREVVEGVAGLIDAHVTPAIEVLGIDAGLGVDVEVPLNLRYRIVEDDESRIVVETRDSDVELAEGRSLAPVHVSMHGVVCEVGPQVDSDVPRFGDPARAHGRTPIYCCVTPQECSHCDYLLCCILKEFRHSPLDRMGLDCFQLPPRKLLALLWVFKVVPDQPLHVGRRLVDGHAPIEDVFEFGPIVGDLEEATSCQLIGAGPNRVCLPRINELLGLEGALSPVHGQADAGAAVYLGRELVVDQPRPDVAVQRPFLLILIPHPAIEPEVDPFPIGLAQEVPAALEPRPHHDDVLMPIAGLIAGMVDCRIIGMGQIVRMLVVDLETRQAITVIDKAGVEVRSLTPRPELVLIRAFGEVGPYLEAVLVQHVDDAHGEVHRRDQVDRVDLVIVGSAEDGL